MLLFLEDLSSWIGDDVAAVSCFFRFFLLHKQTKEMYKKLRNARILTT